MKIAISGGDLRHIGCEDEDKRSMTQVQKQTISWVRTGMNGGTQLRVAYHGPQELAQVIGGLNEFSGA